MACGIRALFTNHHGVKCYPEVSVTLLCSWFILYIGTHIETYPHRRGGSLSSDRDEEREKKVVGFR